MKSKNKKAKLISVSLLALCFSMLAFGVYALKQATLTVQGTVGFKAHDCMVTVSATIAGDAVLTSEVNNETVYTPDEDGTPSVTRVFFGDQQLGRNGVTSKSLDNTTNPAIPEVYFSDLTEDGTPETIVITFTMTNESFYAVTASLSAQVTANKPVTATRLNNGSALLQPSGQQGATQTLSVSFDLGQTEGDYADLSGFEYIIDIDFAKYVAPAQQNSIADVTLSNYDEMSASFQIQEVSGASSYQIGYFQTTAEGESLVSSYTITPAQASGWIDLTNFPATAGTYTAKVRALGSQEGLASAHWTSIGQIHSGGSQEPQQQDLSLPAIDMENLPQTVSALVALFDEGKATGVTSEDENFSPMFETNGLVGYVNASKVVTSGSTKYDQHYSFMVFDSTESATAFLATEEGSMFTYSDDAVVCMYHCSQSTFYSEVGDVEVVSYDSSTGAVVINSVQNATGYRVELFDENGVVCFSTYYSTSFTITTYNVADGSYTAKIRAYANGLNGSIYSENYTTIGTYVVQSQQVDPDPEPEIDPNKISVSAGDITLSESSGNFDGGDHSNAFGVRLSGNKMEEGYSLRFEDSNKNEIYSFVNAGVYTVIVVLDSNTYTGVLEHELTYTINKTNITDSSKLSLTNGVILYTGSDVKDSVNLQYVVNKYSSNQLVKNYDYSLTFKDSENNTISEVINEGTYIAVVSILSGGNLTNTSNIALEYEFGVSSTPETYIAQGDVAISGSNSRTYNGNAISNPSIKLKGSSLSSDKYTIVWKNSNSETIENPVHAGEYTIVVTITDESYQGKMVHNLSYTIRQLTIQSSQATSRFSFANNTITATGEDVSNELSLIYNSNKSTRKDVDYSITFYNSNNELVSQVVDAGSYTARIALLSSGDFILNGAEYFELSFTVEQPANQNNDPEPEDPEPKDPEPEVVATPTNVTLSGDVLSFTASEDATSYEIAYFNGNILVSSYEINSTSATLANKPISAGTYTVKVRAKKVDSETTYSDYVFAGIITVGEAPSPSPVQE